MTTASLPQLAGGLFLSDGGLETTLVYLEGLALPHFAAFVLLKDEAGREHLRRYYRPYLELCAGHPRRRLCPGNAHLACQRGLGQLAGL